MTAEYVDEACVVLVREPERAVYVVGYATPEEAKEAIRQLYQTERNIELVASQLSAGDVKGLKLKPKQVRPWH
jgi:hypothetical protein